MPPFDDMTRRLCFSVASLAPGGELVLEYVVPEELLAGEDRQYLAVTKAAAAQGGQPWRGSFAPARLAALLKELGFVAVTDLDAARLNARYFARRRDGLRTSAAQHLVKARVGAARR